MANTVWKIEIDPTAPFPQPTVRKALPAGAKVLAVHEQHGQVCIWVEVDDTAPLQAREFEVVGTGHAVPGKGVYLGTAYLYNGGLVLHVYEIVQGEQKGGCNGCACK